jgi:hypothetical protein
MPLAVVVEAAVADEGFADGDDVRVGLEVASATVTGAKRVSAAELDCSLIGACDPRLGSCARGEES